MGIVQKLTSIRVARFAIVGLANTIVNFAVLNFAVFGLHLNKIVASIIATACAIIFSFIMNRSFVFNDRERPFRKFLIFTVVAASGVLAIQTTVYSLCVLLLRNHVADDFAVINVSNLVASLCVMLWNYNGYRLLVFNNNGARLEDDGLSKADEAA